ncbi:MAG: methyltransferase domain-containing protein [Gammaproteobacteria bacterium]|nr:methyltransferase domain-containing protein [Gammaproteobacteria bacterium]
MNTQRYKYPEEILPSLRDVSFVCPLCHGELVSLKNGFYCKPCAKKYRLHGGIPDFRVFPDPYLDYEQDRVRTNIILDKLEKMALPDLLEFYWSLSDVTPKSLRSKFIRSVMLGEYRAQNILETIGCPSDDTGGDTLIEIGSGTGNFLAVAVSRYRQVIGVDIAMRWLHLSRRRFMDLGIDEPPLVCCCAEYLPFPKNSFNTTVSSSTLEFVRDPTKTLSECARTLKKDGLLYINTVNRYSIARDPYVNLWGVGYLPRSWQNNYVRWRRQADYKCVNLLSLNQIRSAAAKSFSIVSVGLPNLHNSILSRLSTFERLQAKAYLTLKKLTFLHGILIWITPHWDITLRK